MKMDDKPGMGGVTMDFPSDEACPAEGPYAQFPMDPFPGYALKRSGPCGPCIGEPNNMAWRALEMLLAVRHYGTVFVDVTRDAGTGALIVSPSTGATNLYRWFMAGNGEAAATTGLFPAATLLTRAETSAFAQGALAPDMRWDYRIVGAGVTLELPFRTGTVNADPAARTYDTFWRESTYVEAILRAVISDSWISFRHGNTDFAYQEGKLSFFPSMSQVSGNIGARVGHSLAGSFIPFRTPEYGGGPDDDDKLVIELNIAHTLVIPSDPANPTVALPAGEHYLLPLVLELYGSIIKSNAATSASDVRAIVRDETNARINAALAAVNQSDPAEMRAALKMIQAMTGK